MKTRTLFVCLSLALFALALGTGCRNRPPATTMDQGISLGVAPFTQPRGPEDLLGGYLPDTPEAIKTMTLGELDVALADYLRTNNRPFKSSEQIGSCVLSTKDQKDENAETRHMALNKWVRVGKCASVDFLLVPQVLYWKERQGGAAGAVEPASVILDLYVVDVRNHSVAGCFRFNETQVSLTDNLLTMPKFMARGGKWLTALELAQSGIAEGMKRLGL